jgi:hypothetical protein
MSVLQIQNEKFEPQRTRRARSGQRKYYFFFVFFVRFAAFAVKKGGG